MARYADRRDAEQYTAEGQLRCDRCGRPLKPWPLVRPDNCGGVLGAHCLRWPEPVLDGWKRSRAKLRMAKAGLKKKTAA